MAGHERALKVSKCCGITADASPSVSPYRILDRERKEIRLALLKAGCGHDSICCKLLPACLSEHPMPLYETISYCWGDDSDCTEVCLNGWMTPIPTRAKVALQHMRHADADRILWIDSVCINQGDNVERAHQVSLMNDMFSNTQRTLIWLGPDDGSTAAALQTMALVLNDAQTETDDFAHLDECTVDASAGGHHRFSRFSDHGFPFDITIGPLVQFFSAPWFHRLWVVQESTLPVLGLCYRGSHEIKLLDVLRTALWLSYKRRFIPFDVYALSCNVINAAAIWDIAYRNHGPHRIGLTYLILRLKYFEASDPRDHVFGILGLYQRVARIKELPPPLTPNYTKPVPHVVRDAVRFAIEEDNTVVIWQFLSHRPAEKDEHIEVKVGAAIWPSWVPHLERILDYKRDPHVFANPFRADAGVPMEIQTGLEVVDPDVLSIKGITLGTVKERTRIVTQATLSDAQQLLNTLDSLHSLIEQSAKHHKDDSRSRLLGAILIAGTNSQRHPATDEDRMGYLALREYITERGELPPTRRELNESGVPHNSQLWQLADYSIALRNGCLHRRHFSTSSGFIGVGPQLAEEGDIVAVLFGSMWPVILHPCSGGHNMVGLCYVDGVMQGEAVKRHHEQDKDDVTFYIH